MGPLMAGKTEAIAEQAAKELAASYAHAKSMLLRRLIGCCDKGNPVAILTLANALQAVTAAERNGDE
jgi:hypothetical protein